MDRQIKNWGQLMLGVPKHRLEPCLSCPPMPWIRDPVKSKGAVPPAVSAEILLGEGLDAALAWWLQQEKQITEALWRGEDHKFLCAAQRLAPAEEERLGVDAATLAIVEDKPPITKQIKKKRRWKSTDHPSYMEEEETQEKDWECGKDKEFKSNRAAPVVSHHEQVHALATIYHFYFGLCIFAALWNWGLI